MWQLRTIQLNNRRGIHVAVDFDSSPVTYSTVLKLWQDDPSFRSMFIEFLASSPFVAFRWETPPVTTATAERPFEFVVLDSPELARTPDANAFSEHFDGKETKEVVQFSNLGNDAIMIVPTPRVPISAYGHLASFVRQAPSSQQHALWQSVGSAMQGRLGVRPVWLSTAGAGVAWLHVRLDDRPKYYAHAPYRVMT